MNNLQAIRDQIQKTFPGKEFTLSLTDACKKGYDITCTDGKPNMWNHVIYNMVLVTIEGREPQLASIQYHREVISFVDLKEYFDNLSESGVPDTLLRQIKDLPYADREPALDQISADSLIPIEELKKRFDSLDS